MAPITTQIKNPIAYNIFNSPCFQLVVNRLLGLRIEQYKTKSLEHPFYNIKYTTKYNTCQPLGSLPKRSLLGSLGSDLTRVQLGVVDMSKFIGKKKFLLTCIGVSEQKDKDGRRFLECMCKCGNKCLVKPSGMNPKSSTKSCGCFRISQGETLKKFHERYEKNLDGCWIWTGSKSVNGYGRFHVDNKEVKAHRYAYEYFKGSVGENYVCHTCDNPSCVNPDHLFLGEPKDNSADMVRKGRSLRNEKNPNSKLKESDVKKILQLYSEGMDIESIKIVFGISNVMVRNIIKGKNWKEVAKEFKRLNKE